MNAGMYGMANGQGLAGRKFIGRAGSLGAVQPTTSPASSMSASMGRSTTAVSLVANTRTLVASVSGSGAIRGCAINAVAGFTPTLTVEVFIDGSRVVNVSAGSVDGNTGQGISAVGGSSNSVGVLDFLPFTSSCEVYYTSTASGSHSHVIAIDLYQ